MKKKNISIYRCPLTGCDMELKYEGSLSVIKDGLLYSKEANKNYLIKDGCIDFITPDQKVKGAAFAIDYYAKIAETYDENVHLTFELYNENEIEIRARMIDLLELTPNHKVLEVSAGTGKDSELISKKLSKNGGLWVLDISSHMMLQNMKRMKSSEVPIEYVIASACALPFKDNSFDALYCFSGVGHFPDLPKGLQEMARVVKKGGKVVFCEKNVPEWLRKTEYGKICINNNPMFADPVPLKYIPVEARNVGVRWINGNVHYVFDYTVGEGAPIGNFDLTLPGERGGTFNSRYFGQLEGVSEKTKKLALKAREKLGLSMHEWIDELVKKEAKKIINEVD